MNPGQTLTWLEAPEARRFNELLLEWIDEEYKTLRTSNDLIEIHRAQGALKRLSQIIELPSTIRSYLRDVAEGKRQKIEVKER
jgi:ABC-type uncharacterized transport system ATPase subunit